MKLTRTDNNKPSQSTPIRKGKLSPEEIKRTAEELTKNQLTIKSPAPKNHNKVDFIGGFISSPFGDCDNTGGYALTTTGSAIKTYKTIVEKKAPKIEPVEHGNYEIYSAYVKAHCKMHDTYETTGDELKKMFPQNKEIYDIVRNLKRSHGISWRRVENGRNDTYVFFVEPTREELMMEIARLEKSIDTWFNNSNKHEEEIMELQDASDRLFRANADLAEENTQLKSDLFYSKRSNIITFAFAIGAVITIIFKSVAL